jgi:aspartate kinase
MGRLIQKFDGGSFIDPANIKQAAELVVAAARDGYEVASVVSPNRQTCREWLKLARGLSDQPNVRELNHLLAANEQFATTLLSLAIESLGFPARSLASSTIAKRGMIKDSCEDLNTDQLEQCMARGEIAVVGGSAMVPDAKSCDQAIKDESDLLAVALASALDAERCEYFIESDGVYTADPKLIPDAKRIATLSYDEALELANAGAKLLSADALELAAESHMPLRIRSTANADDLGTLVTHRFVTPAYTVCGIAVDDNMVAVNLMIATSSENYDPFEGVSPVFARFTELAIDTDMLFIMSREDQPLKELGFVIKDDKLGQVLRVLESNSKQLGQPSLHVDQGLSRISIIGSGLSASPEVVALIFETLNTAQIPIKLVATSELRMSLLLPSEFAHQAVKIIHRNVELLTTTDGTVQI